MLIRNIGAEFVIENPELVLYECLAKVINEPSAMGRSVLVGMAQDAFEEYQLQTNSIIL